MWRVRVVVVLVVVVLLVVVAPPSGPVPGGAAVLDNPVVNPVKVLFNCLPSPPLVLVVLVVEVLGGCVPSVFGRNLQCEPVRNVDTREECHWSHACSSFKRAGVGTNGILECKFLSKKRAPCC
jgi:hypothetical protein